VRRRDPEPLVAEFDRTHAVEAAAPALVPTPAVDPDAAARAERRQPNWAAAMAVVLVIVCIAAAVSLIGNRGGNKSGAQSSGPPASHPTPSVTQTQPPASPPPSAQAFVYPNDAIALIRVTTQTTWLSVETSSGQPLFEGLLQPGARKVFRDGRGLRLVIGNAPAVDLVANGRDMGAPRAKGNVAHVTILRGQAVQYA
jgi:cytoskeleton protein RodZ